MTNREMLNVILSRIAAQCADIIESRHIVVSRDIDRLADIHELVKCAEAHVYAEGGTQYSAPERNKNKPTLKMTNREMMDITEVLLSRLDFQIAGYSNYGSDAPERLSEIREWIRHAYAAYYMDLDEDFEGMDSAAQIAQVKTNRQRAN